MIFLYGTLRDAGLRAVVFGQSVPVRSATLDGHAVRWAEGGDYPLIRSEPGARAEGLLADFSAAPEAFARADFYERTYGYETRPVTVETAEGPVAARVWWPPEDGPAAGAPFDLADWAERVAPLHLALASELLAMRGALPDERIAARTHAVAVRAQARVNARHETPTTLRRRASAADVAVAERRFPYAAFFAVEEYDLQHRRFDGAMSEPLERATFVSGDAVTVLPYDPVRDRVLLVEQFRAGPFARGDGQPWTLEAVAGRIDPGESPETTARREAEEEAGLRLGALIPLGGHYPSPAAKTEFIFTFIAIADLPDAAAGQGGGIAGEGEDIRTHVVPFERLMALMESGEVANGPLIVTALHLARRREGLRVRYGG